MPTLTSTEIVPLMEVAEIIDPSKPRSEGHHVSELITTAEKVSGKKTYYDKEPDAQSLGIMAMGRIWEAIVRPYLETRVQVWGYDSIIFGLELEKDGIYGSLDGAFIGQSQTALSEMKCRFSGPRDDFPLGHWRYMTQIKTYCKMLDTTKACMPVLHIENRPPRCTFILYWIEFEAHEIEENWQMMLNLRDYER